MCVRLFDVRKTFSIFENHTPKSPLERGLAARRASHYFAMSIF